MTKTQQLIEDQERELRNPQIEFVGQPNLTVQTGNKSIGQQMEDFQRASRAIQVARADQTFPETPGLPVYPDVIETELLRREIDADLLIARKRLLEDQDKAFEAARTRAEKNQKELDRINAAARAAEAQQGPKETPAES